MSFGRSDIEEETLKMSIRPFWEPVPAGLLYTPETIRDDDVNPLKEEEKCLTTDQGMTESIKQGSVIYKSYGILRITNRLYLRIRFREDTKTFDFILERNNYGKITDTLIMSFNQYIEMLSHAEEVYANFQKNEDNVKIQLPNNLCLFLHKKFVIFKQYDLEKKHTLKNLALNMEQFEKLCMYYSIVLTLCPELKC